MHYLTQVKFLQDEFLHQMEMNKNQLKLEKEVVKEPRGFSCELSSAQVQPVTCVQVIKDLKNQTSSEFLFFNEVTYFQTMLIVLIQLLCKGIVKVTA